LKSVIISYENISYLLALLVITYLKFLEVISSCILLDSKWNYASWRRRHCILSCTV